LAADAEAPPNVGARRLLAPFINGTLHPRYAHAENYRNGAVHPSLGNYIALEAGDPRGIDFDAPPSQVPLDVACHLADTRPERHFPDSFITVRLSIARWLPRCPACHRPRNS
jgi:hypothetical protein